jgi:hypothetical protein
MAIVAEPYPSCSKGLATSRSMTRERIQLPGSTTTLAMQVQEINKLVVACYFPILLEGPARTWLSNPPIDKINSWEELWNEFVNNFSEATCNHQGPTPLHPVTRQIRTRLAFTMGRGLEFIQRHQH